MKSKLLGKISVDPKALGRAVRQYCQSEDSYAVLDATGAEGGTWTSGGCWILAEAVAKGFGGRVYCLVGTPEGFGEETPSGVPSPQHFVAKVGHLFIDADGASTEKTLLHRWEKVEHVRTPFLEAYAGQVVDQGTPRPEKTGEIIDGINGWLKPSKTAEEKEIEADKVDFNKDGYWAGDGNSASGILTIARDTKRVCLAWRSADTHTGNCFGAIGGAVKEDRSPEESARVELKEEVGYTGPVDLYAGWVFRDKNFRYFNFIGVVPSEFSFNPAPSHAWETEFIEWLPVAEIEKDMEENPGDYHPGLIDLFQHSHDLIHKLVEGAELKTASPDLGYTTYNDREKDLKELRWEEEDGGYGVINLRAFAPGISGPATEVAHIGIAPGRNPHTMYVVGAGTGGAEESPEWRGTGLGQMLYDKAIAKCKELGITRLYQGAHTSVDAKHAWDRLSRRYTVRVDEATRGKVRYVDLTAGSKTAADPTFASWLGVDLDGVLAKNYAGEFDPLKIGEPIPAMVAKVRAAIEAGMVVKVFTARMADQENAEAIRKAIGDYTEEHIGTRLDATNEKDPGMVEIWDDKARRVIEDTGKFASAETAISASRRVPGEPDIQKEAFVANDLIYLKNYLTMSDRDKGEELARSFPDQFMEFLEEEDPDLKEKLAVGEDEFLDDYSEVPDQVLVQFLKQKASDIMEYDPTYAPLFLHGDYQGIVKNQWLIHFTDDAVSVARSGFRYGIDDMRNLGLTTSFTDEAKKSGGYNFAYKLSDFERHAFEGNGTKYGRECVLFRASGVEIYHYGDEEPQVVFWGKDATDIIPVKREDGEWCLPDDDQDKPVFKSEDLGTVTSWVVQHFPQYRKTLLGKQASPAVVLTETPAFKRWFAGSKIVDEQGRPVRMYHGSKTSFDEFKHEFHGKTDAGFFGLGFYFTDAPGNANSYARTDYSDWTIECATGAQVYPVYLKVTRPYLVTDYDKEFGSAPKSSVGARNLSDRLQAEGYDGVILRAGTPFREVMVFHPNQIKSAIGNNGEFDPESTRITAKKEASVTFDPMLQAILDSYRAQGVTLNVSPSATGDYLTLDEIRVPKENRKQGIGSEFLKQFVAYADQAGKTIFCTPSKDFGATSVSRLKEFYRRFGFKPNTGRYKDFRSRDTMVRQPVVPKTASPDFGYTQYNDREKDLRKLVIRPDRMGRLLEVVATQPGAVNSADFEGYVCCEGYKYHEPTGKRGEHVLSDKTGVDAFAVTESQITEAWRGTGLGQLLYERLIKEAARAGAVYLFSDDNRTPEADRAWERLAQRHEVVWIAEENRWRLTLPLTGARAKAAMRKQIPSSQIPMPELKKMHKELREEEGPGQCYTMADWLESKYGWEKQSGFYLPDPTKTDHTYHKDHAWNETRDRTLVDATHDQFGPPDVLVLKPGAAGRKHYHAYCGDYNCPICTCDICNEDFAREAREARAASGKTALLSKNPPAKPDANYLEGSNGWAIFPDQRAGAYITAPVKEMAPDAVDDGESPEEHWINKV